MRSAGTTSPAQSLGPPRAVGAPLARGSSRLICDPGIDLFEAFLDPRLVRLLPDPGATIDDAQLAKLERDLLPQVLRLRRNAGMMFLQAIVIDGRLYSPRRLGADATDMRTVWTEETSDHCVRTLSLWRERFEAAWTELEPHGWRGRAEVGGAGLEPATFAL